VRASKVARISTGYESAWRMTYEQDATYNALGHALRRELSPGQAHWELDASRRRRLDAIAAATERGLDASRYGEAALRSGHEAEHAGWIARWRAERDV